MESGFGYTDVGTWLSDLPDELVSSIGQEPGATTGFGFVVRADPVEVHVTGTDDGDEPLCIESTVTYGEAAREAIRSNPDRFFAESSAVLASAPGFHRLTDGDGSAADVDSFTDVVLRHYLYPDGANKHAVLNGVIDVLTAATHLHEAGERLAGSSGSA
jgi:hypothetical protein